MNKKIISIIIVAVVVAIILSLIYLVSRPETDAIKFKKEYESLNGQVNDKGNEYREISISKKNPIKYATADDIVEMMDNDETFAVYFGFSKCPWCRSVIPTMLEVADDLEIDTIYYVDVLDIRNTLEVDDSLEVIETKKGTDGYYKLLEKFADVLDDYSLSDSEGNSVDTNQKRIYAPNIAVVLNGKAEDLTTGISDNQEDGYQELTKSMKKEMYNKIKCTLECLDKEVGICTKNAC